MSLNFVIAIRAYKKKCMVGGFGMSSSSSEWDPVTGTLISKVMHLWIACKVGNILTN
jgi:hypothetical protein